MLNINNIIIILTIYDKAYLTSRFAGLLHKFKYTFNAETGPGIA